MYSWKEVTSIDTILFSDSTEISPNSNLCINCCYQLNEKTGIREGSISLIDISKNAGNIVANCLNLDGILDCSWLSQDIFILAGASGQLYIYGCDDDNLRVLNTIEIDNDSLSLSVDYFNNKFLCSSSNGCLTLLDGNYNITSSHKAHDYEAWVGHLSRHHNNLYFSGSDDCKFKGFDLRKDNQNIYSVKFDMGVTSIGSHPINDNIISVGSYDERLRLFDIRNMRQQVSEFDIGGGVWRHKWCPDGGPMMLIAAMYAGFAVLNSDDGSVLRLTETTHKNCLGYGADWKKDGNDYVAVLSSFYDHRWSLSRLSLL